jgi:hypothetical protein
MFANVDFGTRKQPSRTRDHQAVTTRELGSTTYTQDAGWVSGAHRFRSYGCSWAIWKDLKENGRPKLHELLGPDHLGPDATFNDLPPMAPLDVRGKKEKMLSHGHEEPGDVQLAV